MSDPLAGVIRPRLAVQGARPEQVFAAPAQQAAAPTEVAVVCSCSGACGLHVNSGLAASSSSETPWILRRIANLLISATA